MRRVVLLLVFLSILFALPGSAGAGSDVILESLTIQLWPDHDQPAVLVIYDFTLDANTTLPVSMRFKVPSSASLVAVARNSENGMLKVKHELTLQDAGGVATFTVAEHASYHLEYYVPYMLEGSARNFFFTWPGDYAAKSFTLILQEPIAATNILTDPLLANIPVGKDGFSYQATQVLKLAAQETFELAVYYENESDTLTVSTLSVKPSSPLTENLPGQVSLMTYAPWILAGLALILIVGGIGWYWFSSRGEAGSSRLRRPRIARRKTTDAPAQDREIYCHQCGKRAQPNDRFCRTCGVGLKQADL